ncbi:MAG: serine/threonine protein kinase, partial [Anaerolineales bacterium]|nr:serine/threonine protein kinase [Anaerolineales bacterium]
MENNAGKVFLSRFRVDELLLSTETAARYRGYDLKRGLLLLIKIYASTIQPDETVLCFQQRNLTLQTAQHPNVIPFYGLYDDQGHSLTIEKFIEGPSLAQILSRESGKPLPPNDALVYLKSLTAALEYAHDFGLVHATLDAANVQVGRDGTVMLGNFGFARFIDKPMTSTGVFGPPLCQAPEQLRGERVHPSTDIYALGILFYELLTGVHPFLGVPTASIGAIPSPVERLRDAHLNQAPPAMNQYNPALPGGLSQTVLTALAKDPQQRYQSAQEMLEICSAVLGSSPAQIPPRLGGRPGVETSAPTQVAPQPPAMSAETYARPGVAPTEVVLPGAPGYPGGTQVVPGQPYPPPQPAYPGGTQVISGQPYPPQQQVYPGGAQVVPDQPYTAPPAGYPAPPYYPPPLEPAKPSRPAWLLPMIGLLILAILICGAVGVWASLPLLGEVFGSPSATPTATLTLTPTFTLVPPTEPPPPAVVPPTEAPLLPTEPLPPTEPPPPTEAPTLPPMPTSTPERTAF